MPTPSSNAPDPQSPRSYPFSSCPEPDENVHHPQTPQSPSSWHPHPPLHYVNEDHPAVRTHQAMDDENETSRSATMSPLPEASDAREHVVGEPEGMVLARGGSEDSAKQTDDDEEMTNNESESTDRARTDAGLGNGGHGSLDEPWSGRRSRPEMLSPVSIEGVSLEGDKLDDSISVEDEPGLAQDFRVVGMGSNFSELRIIPTSPSSFLRPGSRFHGTQTSERQRYDVQVELKHVDLRDSFLCGYLRIQGLTEDHPTLTTYFEGEIIGPRYGFITQHPSWGASDKIDISHWSKFTAFRPYSKQARKGGQVLIKDVAQRENIFMRWKEHFLVPDHRVRTINGASFEGFYYICFNQARGEVSGIYFHSKSEKFQQLELKHVEDKGCYGALEFR